LDTATETSMESKITTMKAAQELGVARDAVRSAARKHEIGTFVKGRYHYIRVFTPEEVEKIRTLLTTPARSRKAWRPEGTFESAD
jgi:hypothetical protein